MCKARERKPQRKTTLPRAKPDTTSNVFFIGTVGRPELLPRALKFRRHKKPPVRWEKRGGERTGRVWHCFPWAPKLLLMVLPGGKWYVDLLINYHKTSEFTVNNEIENLTEYIIIKNLQNNIQVPD